MVFKVNYSFQKAERDRAKKAKKDAKLREREAAGQARAEEAPTAPPPSADSGAGEAES